MNIQKMTILISIALTVFISHAHAQCGNMPNISNPGGTVRPHDLPPSYHTVHLDPGAIVYPAFTHPNGSNDYHVGTLTAIYTNHIDYVTSSPFGDPAPIEDTDMAGIVTNLEADCQPHEYDVTYTNLVSHTESWGTSVSFEHSQALEESVKFGIENSSTSLEYGLSNSQSYTQSTGSSFEASAQIGSGVTATARDRLIPSCYRYTVMPVAHLQRYRLNIRYYRTVYDINAYYDLNGDDIWDTRGPFLFSCSAAGSGTVTTFGQASVFVGPIDIQFRGSAPIPDSECPCSTGGGDDFDGDGILDGDDDDMDGDGITNDHDDDTDGDTIDNDTDTDDDNDGIPDSQDDSSTGPDGSDDIDGDGISNDEDDNIDGDDELNHEDDDMDGDGIDNEDDADADADGQNDLAQLFDALQRFLDWIIDAILNLF